MAYSSTQVLAKLIEENVDDLRLQTARTLSYLSRNGRVRRGDHTDLYWNAILSGSNTATAAMSVAGADQTTGDAVQASLSIGANKIYHQFTVSLVDMVNAKNAGVGKLKNLFRQNVASGMLAIKREINRLIWAGDGSVASAGIVGLNTVSDAAVSYAGISPTTYTQWVPITNTSATARALTRDLLYAFSQKLDEEEAAHDSLFCTPAMANTYNKLFDTTAGINSVNIGDRQNAIDLGYSMRSYNGVPIITDPQMPTGRLMGLNASGIELISLDLADADSGQLAALGLKNNLSSIASAEVGGLVVNVALLPQSNPGLVSFQMLVLPQLKVANRRDVQGILNLT